MLQVKTVPELNRQSFGFLEQATDGKITMLSPGSTARALIETVNQNIGQYYNALSLHHTMAYVTTATGVYLDLIAELFGISRRTAEAAFVSSEDSAVRFYVTSGTLYDKLPKAGDLNRGLIPSGTTVRSSDATIVYTVDRDVTFPRTATEVFVPVRASVTGVAANVGAHVLRSHSLPVSAVYVTNPTSITSGRDTESDDELRSRIHDTVRSQEGANEAAIRLAVLSAPGVADVQIIPFIMGAGSFDAMIIPVGNRVSKETFQVAKQNLSSAVAFGIYWRLREPKYVRFSMVLSLTFKSGRLAGEANAIRARVEQTVLNFMGDIRMGDELVLTQLGAAILQTDDRIQDYDIQALCINGRPQLLHNYRLERDELFIPDENLSDPVRVL